MSKIIKENKLVISDYNWLPEDLKESWVDKYTDDYIIYDKLHRESWVGKEKIIQQLNIGQNVYDMFDFIINNYDNLPPATIFCRSCLFFPKGRVPPLSNGNFNEEDFKKVCNNTTFTELHDFGPDCHNGHGSKLDVDGFGYLEINNSWYLNHVKTKYFHNLNDFLYDVYKNPVIPSYIRFAPGVNYLIPKTNILKYSKNFYEQIRKILSWDIVVGEAHILERCIYTIFMNDWEVNEKYK
tara:strand:+ start:4032 stop:4748 length:717 start_codon:yes stop_codon:yes gene_type:complete